MLAQLGLLAAIALSPLPKDKLVALAPLLVHGDVGLIESHADGTMKQVTLILLVAAPPETLHEILTHPALYPKFVPNVSRASWEPREAGGVYRWRLDLPVSSFENTNVYAFEPGPAGAVNVRAGRAGDDATYRWEMLPVAGGTVLVQYGYTDVKRSNALVKSFLKRMPVTEHGLALAAQMMLTLAVKREAERRTPEGTLPPIDTGQKSPGFGFLLERGQVAVMRSIEGGRLGDVSVIDRIYAPADKVHRAIANPGEWGRFIPGVEESRELERASDQITFRMDFSIPLVTWSTRFTMRVSAAAVDALGIDGDLHGARFRWDLTPRSESETLAVYRVNQRLGQSSLVFRKLIEHDHALEHGLNVAFSLVYLRAIRGRAEGWGAPR